MPVIIDLRSDTVTRPTPDMRAAMAAAEVGDDVYGEDPTVNHLERRAADLFGREAPSCPFRYHGQPDRHPPAYAARPGGHCRRPRPHPRLGDGHHSGLLRLPGPCRPHRRGILTWKQIEPVIYARGAFRAATGLIEIENTANMSGGRCTPLPVLTEIWENAKERKLPTHLDGARIFNAAVALNTDVKTLTSGFDTVMFCLSKGLGAPVGSLLVGSAERMARARLFRKALGGGMRQAGILAAAGLVALGQMAARLHQDHANARLLAEALHHMEGVTIDLDTVETNIVIFRVTGKLSATDLLARLKARGILASAIGPEAIRLVTHYDVDRAACITAAEALTEEIGDASTAA